MLGLKGSKASFYKIIGGTMLVIILVFIIGGSLVDESYSQTSAVIKKSGLPEDVRSMPFDDASRFGIDSGGNLFWDGKRVQTLKEIALQEREFYLAVFGVLAAWIVVKRLLIVAYN